jgi:predicted DNA-binding WGR domain protein
MSTQPYHLRVQRIDPAKNMARFYTMSIEPTLFGDTSLIRNWGRIGTHGQWRVDLFAHETQAVDLFLALLRKKRRKGYTLARRRDELRRT